MIFTREELDHWLSELAKDRNRRVDQLRAEIDRINAAFDAAAGSINRLRDTAPSGQESKPQPPRKRREEKNQEVPPPEGEELERLIAKYGRK